MKGTLSVLAWRVLQARLFQGQEHKAQRGERYTLVAPGSSCADGQALVQAPQVRVQEASAWGVRQLRALWRVRQGCTWCPEEGIALPVNKAGQGQAQRGWQRPTYQAMKDMLKKP